MPNKIPLTKPFFNEFELEELKKVLESGWVAGQGPKNKELEKEFAEYIGIGHTVCNTNCTTALHLSLLVLGIKKGDEVIVPDYTFPATAHAVLYAGATPVFVDIDPKTFNIDTNKIEEKITSKTKAIMPVHTFGQCAEMDEILKIAKKNNLFVIEDAACAVGSKYKEKFAGSFGDMSCFSFHARKNITSGEGGMIASNNPKLIEDARSMSCFGIESAYARENKFQVPQFVKLGYNYKLSDIAASIVLVQLKRSEQYVKKRNELAEYYNNKLKEISTITVPFVEKHNRHAYQSYIVLLDKKINRNDLIVKLGEKGIQTQIGTYSLHRQPVYQGITDCEEKNFPNSSFVFDHSLALPMYYEMSFDDIDRVVDTLKEVLKE
ncbi:DegT/DnrJ/EryC1/StrS family aminotransferase [Candidatus Woesearchaeota archaeon]|nr:DegT/DnrJ/EryC1/StrS family aminotransferase [Candidatus Woesearchaeota archaeon]